MPKQAKAPYNKTKKSKPSRVGADKVRPTPKKVGKLKPQHAKPYRKRHLGLLVMSLVASSLLLLIIIFTVISNSSAKKGANNILSDLFGTKSSQQTSQLSATVYSTYGFTFQYDQLKLYASAVDASSGDLYVGDELSTNRAYSSVRIAPSIADPAANGGSSSINIQYYSGKAPGELSRLEAELVAKNNSNFNLKSSTTKAVDGISFLKSEWQSKPLSGAAAGFNSKFTSYVGIVNGHPLAITVKTGFVPEESNEASLLNVVDSIRFSKPVASTPSPQLSFEQSESNLSLLDRLTFTGSTSAAVPAQPNSSEKISTLYSPAVVKIYNVYCMDILVNGQPYITDACQGGTGSGFFVGNEGYIATNGHVAVSRPIDVAIMYALQQLADGDQTYFTTLVELSGLTEADLAATTTSQQKLAVIADKFYAIPESTFAPTNNVSNILVDLGEKQPEVQELVAATKAREKFPEQDTIKQAELKAFDYRALDGASTGVFKSSDVALLKINGSGYPAVKVGSISSLTQGSGLNIMGYPGAASTNQLVDATQSKATLTSGKVSSIKNATGSQKQLIETDATIGHGNSGGPAFSDAGEVVGIATYTVDGSGKGNGVFNYIRDVADLSELASSSSVNITALSQTQTEWQKGVELFYQAKYSKSLKAFAKVKELYPQHPEVDRLVAVSQQRIASGEEVKDTPVMLIAVGSFFFLLVAGGAVFLIIRHKRHHEAFKQQGLTTPLSSPLSPPDPALGVSTSPPVAANPIDQPVNNETNTPTPPPSEPV